MHDARGDLDLFPARRGHFLLESGHHGDLWLDLELLCLRPRLLARSVAALATQLAPFDVEIVCGPLNEGASVALHVAERMDVEFCHAERFVLLRTALNRGHLPSPPPRGYPAPPASGYPTHCGEERGA